MIHQLYKKQVEAWKERFAKKFPSLFELTDYNEKIGEFATERTRSVKSFISSSRHKDTIELLEAEIERRKRMKPLIVDEFEELMLSFHPDEKGEKITKTWTNIITLIDEDIAYLEEQLELIKKEI